MRSAKDRCKVDKGSTGSIYRRCRVDVVTGSVFRVDIDRVGTRPRRPRSDVGSSYDIGSI